LCGRLDDDKLKTHKTHIVISKLVAYHVYVAVISSEAMFSFYDLP